MFKDYVVRVNGWTITVQVSATPQGDYGVAVLKNGVCEAMMWMKNEPVIKVRNDNTQGLVVVQATAAYGEREAVWL